MVGRQRRGACRGPVQPCAVVVRRDPRGIRGTGRVRVGPITTGGHTSGRRAVGRGCGRLAGVVCHDSVIEKPGDTASRKVDAPSAVRPRARHPHGDTATCAAARTGSWPVRGRGGQQGLAELGQRVGAARGARTPKDRGEEAFRQAAGRKVGGIHRRRASACGRGSRGDSTFHENATVSGRRRVGIVKATRACTARDSADVGGLPNGGFA